ncbi:hypothetical protein CMK11_04265 [Candidatus Poribacteria bacterium]|nr:hypothetical protein [Candidatus Poribacteria bacterium]
MEEFLAVMFLLENMTFVTVGFIVLMVRLWRGRQEKRLEEEQSRSLNADDQQRQISDMRDEMTQMREMMADFLLDMHSERRPATPASQERLGEGTDVDR